MTVHAIHHVNIRANAAQVVALKAFYESLLGLAAGRRPPFKSDGHWLYAAGQPVLHLVVDEAVGGTRDGRGADVDHVAFACTGLRAMEEQLQARQVPYRRTGVPGSPLVQLFLHDPAGNGVELQYAHGDS